MLLKTSSSYSQTQSAMPRPVTNWEGHVANQSAPWWHYPPERQHRPPTPQNNNDYRSSTPSRGYPRHQYYEHHNETWNRPYPNPPPTSNYYAPSTSSSPPSSFHPPPVAKSSYERVAPPVVYIDPKGSQDDALIYEVSDSDVLCGRGAPTTWHPGNQWFRHLVDQYQHQYLAAKRIDKPEIATLVVDKIRERGGRFLKRTKVVNSGGARGHFCWRDIGEQRAYEKTCQALREGAPEIRRQLAARELAAISKTNSDDDRNDRSESSHEREERSAFD